MSKKRSPDTTSSTSGGSGTPPPPPAPITEQEVKEAQDRWKEALLAIGKSFASGDDTEFVNVATQLMLPLYAYGMEEKTVLFKPTKCAQRQFRPTVAGALSYFVGHAFAPADFPEDEGFAINPFLDVRFENVGIISEAGRALAMGNYFFIKKDGQVIKVEYTFGYCRNSSGDVVIDLHHSSLPYQRASTAH
jgi:hypothetical protein